jgi:hypothetical protein
MAWDLQKRRAGRGHWYGVRVNERLRERSRRGLAASLKHGGLRSFSLATL